MTLVLFLFKIISDSKMIILAFHALMLLINRDDCNAVDRFDVSCVNLVPAALYK